MLKKMKFPFYAKISILLIGLYVLISMLHTAQGIILPIIYSIIIAISISPMVNYLINKKINRALAIAGVLSITILIIVAIIGLLSAQIGLLSRAMPQMTTKFSALLNEIIIWCSCNFNISEEKINDWINNGKNEWINNSGSAISSTLSTVGGFLSVVFLTPVYIFMILFYQPHLVAFVHRLFGADNDIDVNEIMIKTKTIVQGYLVGLFLEFAIVATLNSICLMILGIDYAILFGIGGAILNVIPYIGGMIAVGLFMLIAFVTKTPIYAVYVLVLYSIIQFTDNHYIVPKVIGSKVKLNALICLIAVIMGAALWGIPGMFLSIPLTAIIKLIFDHIDGLKTWGFLLGDTTPPMIKFNLRDISKRLPQMMPPFRK
jgi:predicted PurR-regulated permease PerM